MLYGGSRLFNRSSTSKRERQRTDDKIPCVLPCAFAMLIDLCRLRVSIVCPLEVVLIAAGNNHIVDFKHHAAELRSQEELLPFRDERVDDKVLFHV
jgi:hypothetical protein